MSILDTIRQARKPPATPEPEPALEPYAGEELEQPPITTLREGLPPVTALIVFLAMLAAGGYVTYILAIQGTADNNAGAAWADIGIGSVGLLILWFLGAFAWLGERMPIGPLGLLPEPSGLRDDSKMGAESLANYQRRAGAQVHSLIERLIYDYGLMLTGQEPSLDYASGHVRTALIQAVNLQLRGGAQLRPDFGNHVEVSIDWNADDTLRPVTATAYFVDMSTRIAESGLGVQMPRRRMRIIAAFNHQLTQIIDATIGPS